MNDLERFVESAEVVTNLVAKIDNFEKFGEFVSAGCLVVSLELFNIISRATENKNRAVINLGFSPLPLPFDIVSVSTENEEKN